MPRNNKISFDTASAISVGKRDYQEDALITDFAMGSDLGLVVLADGMGGHAAGDIASKIAVTEVYSELKLQSGNIQRFAEKAPQILHEAALGANDCIRSHASSNSETQGMGATLLAMAVLHDQLYWVSVGDSPLYFFSGGELSRLNADHSMAPQIDLMVSLGQMTPDEAKFHPERNCLTSVLCGTPVARVDCPDIPMDLLDGDILIAASDGLQFLDDPEILSVIRRNHRKSAADIAHALMSALDAIEDPDQDNIAIAVIKAMPERALRRSPTSGAIPFRKKTEVEPEAEEEMAMRQAKSTPGFGLSLSWLTRRWRPQ